MLTTASGQTYFVFDVHTHLGISLAFKRWGMNEQLLGDAMIHYMDEAGVDVICTFPPGAPTTNYAEANGLIMQAAHEHPGRIVPFARIHPLFDLNSNVDHIRSLVGQGVKGIKFHPFLDGGYAPNDPLLIYPLMEEIKSHNLVVLFHAGEVITAAPSLIAEVARDFPTVPVVIAHLGTYGFHHEAIAAAKRIENIYVDTSSISHPAVIRLAYRAMGGQRLLFGSDHPYLPFAFEMDKVWKYAGLEDDEVAMVFGGNAANLFGEAVGWRTVRATPLAASTDQAR